MDIKIEINRYKKELLKSDDQSQVLIPFLRNVETVQAFESDESSILAQMVRLRLSLEFYIQFDNMRQTLLPKLLEANTTPQDRYLMFEVFDETFSLIDRDVIQDVLLKDLFLIDLDKKEVLSKEERTNMYHITSHHLPSELKYPSNYIRHGYTEDSMEDILYLQSLLSF